MGDTALNVPIKVRTHELQQLHEMLPDAVEQLKRIDKHGTAEMVKRVYDEHVSDVEPNFNSADQSFAAYVSMPTGDWRAVIKALNRVRYSSGKLRTHWLQTKIIDRFTKRVEELQ